MVNLNMPIGQMTVAEFLELTGNSPASNVKNEKNLIYGLKGLRQLLDCSHPTAQRIKDSGKIPYQQIGRKIIFDADLVLQSLGKKKGATK